MAEVTYRDFYSKFINVTNVPDDGEFPIKCPFHNDSNPSMYINMNSGSWHCKACDAGVDGGGHLADWLVEWFDIPLKEALKFKDKFLETGELGIPVDPAIVDALHNELLENTEALQLLQEKRGVSLDYIKKFQIGFESANNRYTFPVWAASGDVINIRRYKMGAKKSKFTNLKGAYTKPYLWPLDETFWNSSWIVILEGEPDALLARNFGIPAITNTGGAGQWPSGIGHYFTNKQVFICYDNDEAGHKGTQRVGRELEEYAKKVYTCEIPTDDSDFTDYMLNNNLGLNDFVKNVLQKGKTFKSDDDQRIEEQVQSFENITFTEATLSEATNNPDFNNKGVTFVARVQGRESQPYSAPKTVNISANNFDPDGPCGKSPLAYFTEQELKHGRDYTFPRGRDSLAFVDVADDTRVKKIKQAVGLPQNCNQATIEEKEIYNIETLFITPDVEKFSTEIREDELDAQAAYYVYPNGYLSISSNKSYRFNAVRTTNPKDGTASFVILSADPIQEAFDNFHPTREELEELKIFQPAEGQSVKDKMYDIASDLELWTQIWDRKDLIIAYDLVYHSVLRFHFNRKLQLRGWLDLLVVGDPRTGKSETAEYLARYYEQGDMLEGENTRLTGLTATTEQNQGGRWTITWGKFPMNDRKLLIVDEASGLRPQDFGDLSGMRSRGVVEINKARQGQAYARTRAIWMSNPRKGKHLQDYDYGVRAVKELIGQAEDIARFDFAMGVSKDEVPEEVINKVLNDLPREPQKYTSDLCQRLVMWTWSKNAKGKITPENDAVEFTDEAVRELLEQASNLGHKYESSIPLFERNSLRIKLARLAVACAARLFSTDDETLSKIIVTAEHVDFICEFVDGLFENPVFDYIGLAQDEQSRHRVTEEQQREILEWMYYHQEEAKFLEKRKAKPWSSKSLEEGLNMDVEEAREIIATLDSLDLIYDGSQNNTYQVSHKWNEQYQIFKRMSNEELQEKFKLNINLG